jgi:hypothetical protein
MATKKTKKNVVATGKKKVKGTGGKHSGKVDKPYNYIPPRIPPRAAMVATGKKKVKGTAGKSTPMGAGPAQIIPPRAPFPPQE